MRQRLAARAGPAELTLHRAFDLTCDPASALEGAIALGCRRVLTSGGAPTAIAGADRLASLVAQTSGRIGILAGSGISADNVADLLRLTGFPRRTHRAAILPPRILRCQHSASRMIAALPPHGLAFGPSRAA